MLLEIYVLMEFIVFTLFLISFFTRQELLWVLTLALSGIMMLNSYSVEIIGYQYNSTTASYALGTTAYYYPYLMGLNLLVFALSVLFAIFDIWDKFGQGSANRMK